MKSPPFTSQQEGSCGRSLPHQTGEGRITAYQWREHGAAKRDRRSQDKKKKLYLVNLFGFAAFWTREEREANQKKKQAKAGEMVTNNEKTRNGKFWIKYLCCQPSGLSGTAYPATSGSQNVNITTWMKKSQWTDKKNASLNFEEGKGGPGIPNLRKEIEF